MELSDTWFIEGYIDFELQKYRLLAYLKEVNQYFNESKLYPQLSDIVFHYNNLVSFRDNKRMIEHSFPKKLDHIKLQELELVYKKMVEDDELMTELEQIVVFAEGQMKTTLSNGAELYDLVEKQMHIQPIGIMPLYKNEGYMLLQYGQQNEVRAYAYNIALFEHQDAKFRGLHIQYIDSWTRSIVNTYEHIKRDIIRLNRDLPVPAVYCVESPLTLPLNETLLPVAKRILSNRLFIRVAIMFFGHFHLFACW